MLAGEFLETRIEGCQHGHQNAVSLGTSITFAGSTSFANFCFTPHIAFTAIIGGFYFRMF
jgi:hypothetical protein